MYDFTYHRPSSLDDAAVAVKSAGDGTFLAGGQTLLPILKLRLANPSDVVDLGGIAEIVEQEVDGELFPRDDAAALARRLQRLVDEPARLAGYRAAIRPVRTLQQNVDQLEELYGKCLTDAPSPGAPNRP
mgnify:CR=1 FL=1